MKFFRFKSIFPTIVTALIFSFAASNADQASPSFPAVKTIVSKDYKKAESESDYSVKVERLSKLIRANTEQKEELEAVCKFIQENWDEWTEDQEGSDSSFYRFQVTDKTVITVHPNVPEVCIFLSGHTQELGEGVFKKVFKAVSYVLEDEVAVAMPRELLNLDFLKIPKGQDFESFFYSSLADSQDLSDFSSTSSDESDYGDFSDESDFTTTSSSWSSTSSEDSSSNPFKDSYSFGFLWENTLVQEAKMLEAVQGLPGVIQVHFISYHEDEESNLLPIFVIKYYNGNALWKNVGLLSKEDTLLVCHDLLLGLSEVQKLSIAHNDLHWGNVLLHKDPETNQVVGAYISDFGLAQHTSNAGKFERDRNDLNYILLTLLGYYPETGPMAEFIAQAHEKNMDLDETYSQFVAMLSTIVDKKTERQIVHNSLKTKSIKVKQENYVRWIR